MKQASRAVVLRRCFPHDRRSWSVSWSAFIPCAWCSGGCKQAKKTRITLFALWSHRAGEWQILNQKSPTCIEMWTFSVLILEVQLAWYCLFLTEVPRVSCRSLSHFWSWDQRFQELVVQSTPHSVARILGVQFLAVTYEHKDSSAGLGQRPISLNGPLHTSRSTQDDRSPASWCHSLSPGFFRYVAYFKNQEIAQTHHGL